MRGGGALLLNDAGLVARAEVVREKGTDRSRFFRGQVDKYRWVDIGSSYLLSDVLASQLTSQLESFEEVQSRRHAVWYRYHEDLADWAIKNGVSQPAIPEGCAHPAHLYYLLLPDLENRQAFIGRLGAKACRRRSTTSPCTPRPLGRGSAGWPRAAARSPSGSPTVSSGCRSSPIWTRPAWRE